MLRYSFSQNIEKINQLIQTDYNYINEPLFFSKTPLQVAIENDNVDVVRRLLEVRADPNIYGVGNPPLHEAVEKGNTTFVELLLGKGAKLGLKDTNGNTPLYNAVKHYKNKPVPDRLKIVELLLGKEGAFGVLEVRNKKGDNPSLYATRNNMTNIIELFEKVRVQFYKSHQQN